MRSKKKSLTAKKLKQEQDHNAWLYKMGAHPDQVRKNLPHNAKGKRLGITTLPDYKSHQGTRTVKTSDVVIGDTNKKAGNTYTGDYIVGIATMHKSNFVPVTRKQDGKDYATMRRN